jgi:hypothetical protein
MKSEHFADGWRSLTSEIRTISRNNGCAVSGKKSAKPVGMTGDNADYAQHLEFILDTAESQTAISHQFANVTAPSFGSKEQPEYFGPRFWKQNL